MTEPAEIANRWPGAWRVDVDADVCIGSGMCCGIAPDHFELDDSRSRPLHEHTAPDEDVLYAAENCPVEAILVRHVTTGKVLAPGDGTRPGRV